MWRKMFVVLITLCVSLSFAETPHTINYQGKLTDSYGVGLNGSYILTFRIYDSETGGTALWSETHFSVEVTKGLFSVVLGTETALNLPFDEEYWLEIAVNGEVLSPRIKLTSVPYAFHASFADSVGSLSLDTLGAYLDTTYKDSFSVSDSIGHIDTIIYVHTIDSVGVVDSIGYVAHTSYADSAGALTNFLTPGAGIIGTPFNGSSPQTWSANLSMLGDVDTSGINSGDVLKYDSPGLWTPSPMSTLTDSGNYIYNQDTTDQDANAFISGIISAGILRASPTTPDTFTLQAGMIRTLGSGEDYQVYTFDGTCWRMIYPRIDTITCYGESLSVYAGSDTTICSGTSANLTATVVGGWAPYEYDWNNDGTGDWDDSASVNVSPTVTTTYIVQVRDTAGTIASDSVDVIVASDLSSAQISPTDTQNITTSTYGTELTCSTVGGGVLSYQWGKRSVPGGTITEITGATYSTYTPYGAELGAGTWYIVCAVTPECGSQIITNEVVVNVSYSACPSVAIAVGGTSNECGYSIIQTADGGFAAVGRTNSYGAGDYDVFFVKFNSLMEYQWSRVVGTPASNSGYFVFQTDDNGYLILGRTRWYKLNPSGYLQWCKIPDTVYSYYYDLDETSDGGYILLLDYWHIIKLDSSLEVEWGRKITDFHLCSITQTSDSGYAITGYYSNDIILGKFDSTFGFQWGRKIDLGSSSEHGYSVVQAFDGGYVIVGRYESNSFILKLDSIGNYQWCKIIEGVRSSFEALQTPDSGYIMVGTTNSYGAGGYDIFAVKISSSGELQWAHTYGGLSSEGIPQNGKSLLKISGNKYAIIGYTSSWGGGGDMFVVVFDSDGNSCIGSSFSPTVTTPFVSINTFSISSTSYSLSFEKDIMWDIPTPTTTDCCP